MAMVCKNGARECTGCMRCQKEIVYLCPICGNEPETVYIQDGAVIGCDRCVKEKDAWEVAG